MANEAEAVLNARFYHSLELTIPISDTHNILAVVIELPLTYLEQTIM